MISTVAQINAAMSPTKQIKQELNRRLEIVAQPQFLDSQVSPLLGAEADVDRNWKTRVVQNDGSGAATMEIALNGIPSVFAKLFPDDSGPAIYEKFMAFRAAGFGAGERYQSVEPMDFVPEYNLLLTRAAKGVAISSFLGVDDSALREGAKQAALWLAQLHNSSLRIGKPQPLLDSGELLPLARRLVKMIAKRPEHLSLVLDMVKTLEKLAANTVEGLFVQCHGQYRPIHIFMNGESVTVIDLDRSRPIDPAFDLAEFVHRMRHMMFSHNGSVKAVDEPTQIFLDTYASAVADRSYLTNLRFHWTRYIFHSLNRKMKKSAFSGNDMDANIEFGLSEFENVIKRRFIA